jgi:hypothetical protein
LLETKKFATLYVNVNAGRYGEGVCPEWVVVLLMHTNLISEIHIFYVLILFSCFKVI